MKKTRLPKMRPFPIPFLNHRGGIAMREPERFQVYENTAKELKIKVQKDVTSYLTYSLPLCGILADERRYHWFYNHFIQLFTLSGKGDSFWIDYLEDRDFYREVVEYAILDWESLKDEPDIVKFLKDKIDSGYYVVIILDEYYLPKNSNYQERHYLHQRMVYGYDNTKQEMKAIAFDDLENFTILAYNYETIRDAYEIGKSYYEVSELWVKKENVELVKPNFHEVSFDWKSFLTDLNVYLSGNGDYSKIRPMDRLVFGDQASFNCNVYPEFIRHLNINAENFRYMYLLAEHKGVMYKRLRFVAENFNLTGETGELIEQYYQVARKFIVARNLYIKQAMKAVFYNDQSSGQEMTGKIVDILQWGREEEQLILTKTSKILSDF